MVVRKKPLRIYQGKIILLLTAGLFLQNAAFSAQNFNFEEKVIGSTFKSLARAFVAVTDINKLKASNLKKIKKMGEAKFRKQQAKAYPALKGLPVFLKDRYGVKEDMSKEQAIKNIESLDKQKIYEIIDNVPDATITRLFKQYLSDTRQEIMQSDAVEQVRKLWNKIIQKAN